MDQGFQDVFRFFCKKGKTLKLLNDYKGLPLQTEVRVLSARDSSIVVKLESSQLACLYEQRKTHILDEIFPRAVESQVEALDILGGEVVLSGFRYSSAGVGDRRQLRVVPEEPMLIALQRVDLQESVNGSLLDISREGLGVLIPRYFSSPFIKIGSNVLIQIHLPLARSNISRYGAESQYPRQRVQRPDIDGRFLGLEQALYKPPVSESFHVSRSHTTAGITTLGVKGIIVNFGLSFDIWDRLGIQMTQEHAANDLMLHFISLRQSQCIQELRSIYQVLMREEKNRRG